MTIKCNVNSYLWYEQPAVLLNIAIGHSQIGGSVTRGDSGGIQFQCVAWTFSELCERYMTSFARLMFMQRLPWPKLRKPLIDSYKPNIVAKVTGHIVV